jgi:hypothetical protein
MAARTPGLAAAQAEALRQLASFPLVEALFGRRSRRFALGDEIPDGPLAYKSRHQPVPLSDLERMLVLSAMGGTTGWHYSITRHARYAPHVSQLRRRGRRAHLPLGGRLPHRRAVLHRRHRGVVLPDP